MGYIKNFTHLATTSQRKVILELIETAFDAIQPKNVMQQNFSLDGDLLQIMNHTYSLEQYERVFLIGFGKGSAGICKIIEERLGDKLTAGFDIDVVEETFTKVQFTKGTHPLPSEENIAFTQQVLSYFSSSTPDASKNDTSSRVVLTENDLVLVVICGGGSVMFEAPHTINLATLTNVNKALLSSGATISEMNVIRKHLSSVKGGGLAKLLYPASIASLIFSDVPGNDLSVIASGPTTHDPSTMEHITAILNKYELTEKLALPLTSFTETPKEDKYFQHVTNILIISNLTALHAMQEKAEALNIQTQIYSDKFQSDARTAGKTLIDATPSGSLLLAGGETTIKITGNGKGGRNQALVLASLPLLPSDTILATFDSDGWDFYGFAGALADEETLKKVQENQLDSQQFLKEDNSYAFWEKIGDGIDTGKQESNVSDLFLVWKF